MNPYEQCPNDTDTVESLALEIEGLKGELSRVREFLNELLDACSCEHCGRILMRKHMIAPYGPHPGERRQAAASIVPLVLRLLRVCGMRQLGRKSTRGPRTHRRMPRARRCWS